MLSLFIRISIWCFRTKISLLCLAMTKPSKYHLVRTCKILHNLTHFLQESKNARNGPFLARNIAILQESCIHILQVLAKEFLQEQISCRIYWKNTFLQESLQEPFLVGQPQRLSCRKKYDSCKNYCMVVVYSQLIRIKDIFILQKSCLHILQALAREYLQE